MIDKFILENARKIGWNTEHEMTNQMLIRLVNKCLEIEKRVTIQYLNEVLQENCTDDAQMELIRECINDLKD